MKYKINYKGTTLEFEETPTLEEIKAAYSELLSPKKKHSEKAFYSVTSSQEQIYLYEMMKKNTNLYCIPMIFEINGILNVDIFEKALQEVVNRHSALRTCFELMEDKVVQKKIPNADFVITTIDFSNLIEEESKDKINIQIENEVNSGFSFTYGMLFRCTVIKSNSSQFFILMNIHHIIFDGYSFNVMMKELSSIYSDLIHGRAIEEPIKQKFDYCDYADELNNSISKGNYAGSEAFWLNQLVEGIPYINIRPDYLQEKKNTYAGENINLELNAELSTRLNGLCKQGQTTMHVLLMSTLLVLLYRYTGQNQLAIWTPMSCRMDKELENIIGYFTDMFPFKFEVKDTMSFMDLLSYVKEKCIIAFEHQNYPFSNAESLFTELYNGAKVPDIQIGFEYSRKEDLYIDELLLHPVEIQYNKAKYELDISFIEYKEKFTISLDYSLEKYSRESMQCFLMTYHQLLKSITENITIPLDSLQLVPEQEIKNGTFMIKGLQDNSNIYKNVYQQFEKMVSVFKDKIAVEFEDSNITYMELNSKANQIAHWLLMQEVKQEDKIAVLLDKSINVIACFIGIIKSGCAYMPLNDEIQAEQITQILKFTNTRIVFTLLKYKDRFSEFKGIIFYLDDNNVWDQINKLLMENPVITVNENNLLNVLHTSGTTGTPKGVELPHSGVLRLLGNTEYLNFTEEEIVLQLSALDYDGATMEIWGTLCNGGKLILVKKEDLLNMDSLAGFIIGKSVTTVIFPTQLFNRIVDEHPEALSFLRQIECGGEVISQEHIKKALKYCKPGSIINGYGPTENSFVSTFYRIHELNPKAVSIPIGIPVTNTQAYILDQNRNPVPTCVIGELYLSGDGIAREYTNNQEATSKNFIINPFSSSQSQLYKTGDFVRRLADGNIEFIGRQDGQVKIRGHRIEKEAILKAIKSNTFVDESYIDFVEDTNQDRALIAYIKLTGKEGQPDKAVLTSNLRANISRILPEYMIPKRFIYVDNIPLTHTGKVDVKKLRTVKFLDRSHKAHLTTTQTEKKMFDIWAKILNTSDFDVNDNFFDIGGHSLLLFKILKEVKVEFNTNLSVIDLFRYTTVKLLSNHITNIKNNSKEGKEEEDSLKNTPIQNSDIAIIGMGMRFPLAANPYEFWENIKNGVNCITKLADSEIAALEMSENNNLVPYGGYIDNEYAFEAEFFGISEQEAARMDPQQRILLTCAWEAIEDAGYNIEDIDKRISVYIGGENSNHATNVTNNKTVAESFHTELSNSPEFLPLKISYNYNLVGESMLVNSGCSSSLLAVHMACQSLITRQSEYSIAGGISVRIPQRTGYLYEDGFIMSPDGRCCAFDMEANGTVEGNGAGVVLLKRLEDVIRDKDPIYAVIKGSAVNNDGKNKIGFTAPGLDSQIEVIARAIKNADVAKDSIELIEAHGTGTKLGDQIEIRALKEVFKDCKKDRSTCAIGSIKSNIGHLNMAAGIAGLIKATLAISNKEIPPSININKVNPEFHLEDSPFYVSTERKKWDNATSRRTAGVSSFGIGGTNVHLVLQEFNNNEED